MGLVSDPRNSFVGVLCMLMRGIQMLFLGIVAYIKDVAYPVV
jgi:hypothetical protein